MHSRRAQTGLRCELEINDCLTVLLPEPVGLKTLGGHQVRVTISLPSFRSLTALDYITYAIGL